MLKTHIYLLILGATIGASLCHFANSCHQTATGGTAGPLPRSNRFTLAHKGGSDSKEAIVGRYSVQDVYRLADQHDLWENPTSAPFDCLVEAFKSVGSGRRELYEQLLRKGGRLAYLAACAFAATADAQEAAELAIAGFPSSDFSGDLTDSGDARRSPSPGEILAKNISVEDLPEVLGACSNAATRILSRELASRCSEDAVVKSWQSISSSPVKAKLFGNGIVASLLGFVNDSAKFEKLASILAKLDGMNWFEVCRYEVVRTSAAIPELLKQGKASQLPPQFRSLMIENWMRQSPMECFDWCVTQAGGVDVTAWVASNTNDRFWKDFLVDSGSAYMAASDARFVEKLDSRQQNLMWEAVFRDQGIAALEVPGLVGAQALKNLLSTVHLGGDTASALQEVPLQALPALTGALAHQNPSDALRLLDLIPELSAQGASSLLKSVVRFVENADALRFLQSVTARVPESERNDMLKMEARLFSDGLVQNGLNAEMATNFIETLPESIRDSNTANLISSWATLDRVAASQWLSSLPAGLGKSAGAKAFLPHVVDDAEAWAAWSQVANHPQITNPTPTSQ